MSIVIEVRGIPRPGGGKIGGFNRKTGRTFVRPDNPRTAPWRADVVSAAALVHKGPLLTEPITMTYEFVFPRPRVHFGTGKNIDVLKSFAPKHHAIKPDLTKIIRSTEDALTGVIWKDDSQVYNRCAIKRYCEPDECPGVKMTIDTTP
jgi:Holliday junction resolvase RusA-like endonuclease